MNDKNKKIWIGILGIILGMLLHEIFISYILPLF